MKQFVRSRKWFWNLSFLALFLALVFIKSSKIIAISTTIYYVSYIGALLIINRVYLVKGCIKRWPYFLNLLTLFVILITIIKISDSSQSFLDLSFFFAMLFSISYFFASSLFTSPITWKIYNLTKDMLDLEVPSSVLSTSILSVLCLAIFYPFVVLHIKRLRDIKFSYWWTLLTLIPAINILFEIFLCFKKSARQSGHGGKKKQKSEEIQLKT